MQNVFKFYSNHPTACISQTPTGSQVTEASGLILFLPARKGRLEKMAEKNPTSVMQLSIIQNKLIYILLQGIV